MLRVSALILALFAEPGLAEHGEPLSAINSRALEAWNTSGADAALPIAEEALRHARAHGHEEDQAAWATALGNVAFLRASVGAGAEAETLWSEIIESLDPAAPEAALARLQLGQHLTGQGRATEARELLEAALPPARSTQWHGDAAMALADLLLDMGDHAAFALVFEETVAVRPDLIAPTYGDRYARLGSLATEAATMGRWQDAAALIEAQLTILRTFYTLDDRDQAMRNLMFNRYFLLTKLGDYARARTQLLAWKATGTLSDRDREFIRSQVETALPLAGGGNINTIERLEIVRTAVLFANAQDTGADPRLGLALRTLASAEGHFQQNARAVKSLETGIGILEQSSEGRRHVFLLYDDLAWNFALLGENARADTFYEKSDAARDAALVLGTDPESAPDRAWRHVNRALYFGWTDRQERAQAELQRAENALGTMPTKERFAWQLVRTRIADMALAADNQAGRTGDPAALIEAIGALREAAPEHSPDFSMALSNAADTLMVAGERKQAIELLNEAVEINRAALPDIVPRVLEARALRARIQMLEGNRAAAVEEFRGIVAARKSPIYSGLLPEAAHDFEHFAWLLVDQPDPPLDVIAEAFDALQWTQVTRSAEAVAFLEARLSVDDPARGRLLRERQDLAEAHAALAARLTRAQIGGADRATISALSAELSAIPVQIAAVDSRLSSLGLDALGLGRLDPISLAEVQRLLEPGEMLVTFLLPNLTPGRFPGLDAPSNHVIGVTKDSVRVARMGEASRTTLQSRIQAFRCDMAMSDPACIAGGAKGLRGAMAAGGRSARTEEHFDVAAAHSLFADLFGELAAEIGGYRHLIIAPPPDLLRLPFAALPTSPKVEGGLESVRWLIRNHAISVLPAIYSLRSLRGTDRAGQRRLDRMAGFGDPLIGSAPPARCDDFDIAALRAAPLAGSAFADTAPGAIPLADVAWLASLPRLPDSVCELQAIRGVFDSGDTEIIVGPEATETRVKAMDVDRALQDFDVLVFATHGLTAGESGAAAPGLVLTPPETATLQDDGLLTAGEIAGLELDAQLVVLSACNTAAGEDAGKDGLSGLARAFFQAGARNLLVTHWSVYSEAAVDVTTGFFTAYDEAPEIGFSGALRASVLEILNDPGRPPFHRHPSYWAAFAMVGAD